MPNRNPVKQVFITWPHSPIEKITLRDHLITLFSPEYYKVAQELHKDGTPHLHAAVKFKNPYSCAHIIKKFKEIYPDHIKRFHVRGARSLKQCISYLDKEDDDPLESGIFTDSRTQNTRKARYLSLLRRYPNIIPSPVGYYRDLVPHVPPWKTASEGWDFVNITLPKMGLTVEEYNSIS